jgi:hypothetical protein
MALIVPKKAAVYTKEYIQYQRKLQKKQAQYGISFLVSSMKQTKLRLKIQFRSSMEFGLFSALTILVVLYIIKLRKVRTENFV